MIHGQDDRGKVAVDMIQTRRTKAGNNTNNSVNSMANGLKDNDVGGEQRKDHQMITRCRTKSDTISDAMHLSMKIWSRRGQNTSEQLEA